MSNPINDGGPAFPCEWKDFQPTTGEQVVRESFPGMTLRDWFAGKALQGDLASEGPDYATTDFGLQKRDDILAQSAYLKADAMIRAREEQK